MKFFGLMVLMPRLQQLFNEPLRFVADINRPVAQRFQKGAGFQLEGAKKPLELRGLQLTEVMELVGMNQQGLSGTEWNRQVIDMDVPLCFNPSSPVGRLLKS